MVSTPNKTEQSPRTPTPASLAAKASTLLRTCGSLSPTSTGSNTSLNHKMGDQAPPEHLTDPFNLLAHKIPQDSFPKKRKLRKFYEEQNALIDLLTTPIETEETDPETGSTRGHTAEQRDEISSKLRVRKRIAIYGSLLANILLAILELTAALLSGSLAVFATMSDAIMDLISGLIIITASHLSSSRREGEVYLYPTGKSRFETVGIIIFGTLMSTVSLQIIINSVQRLLSSSLERPDLSALSISLILIAIGTKFLLFLWCRTVEVPSVQVLAQDHRNDIFLNITGLLMGLLSDKMGLPWLDPVGAVFVALVMFRSWTVTILRQGQLISGKVAAPRLLKRVTYLAVTHDVRVVSVESVRAYHCGPKVIVEVDIVLPPEMSLREAHDLGESLQGRLESLEEVERAFVHCDYNFTHEPEHQGRKEG